VSEQRLYRLPAPTGGINAMAPLADMPEGDAIEMVNFFPESSFCSLREGFTSYTTLTGSKPIKTLAQFYSTAGVRYFLAFSNGSIFDVSTATPSSLVTGLANDRWSTHQFNGRIFMANGADSFRSWDGSAFDIPTLAGGVTANNIDFVGSFNRRLMVVENNSTKVWYPGVLEVTGAPWTFTAFDLGGEMTQGGYLIYVGGWSGNTNGGLEHNFVAITSSGEVIVYNSDFPNGSNINRIGHYVIPDIVDARAVDKVGGELFITTDNGVYALSAIMAGEPITAEQSLTNKISRLFNLDVKSYKDNTGWEILPIQSKRMLLVNVPTQSENTAKQWVMNLVTGSWCRFEGMDAICWSRFGSDVYFGTTDGTIYKAFSGKLDNTANILGSIVWAYSGLGDVTQSKRLQAVNVLAEANASIDVGLGVGLDYEANTSLATTNLSTANLTSWGSSWGSPWSGSKTHKSNWVAYAGYGKAVSPVLTSYFKNISVDLSAIDIKYETGDWR